MGGIAVCPNGRGGRQFSTIEERVLLSRPSVGRRNHAPRSLPPGVLLRLRPAYFQDLPVFANCPNGSKSDQFIVNWQAKLLERGIAFCHCSKTAQFGVLPEFSGIYRKLLNWRSFEAREATRGRFAPESVALEDGSTLDSTAFSAQMTDMPRCLLQWRAIRGAAITAGRCWKRFHIPPRGTDVPFCQEVEQRKTVLSNIVSSCP